MSYQSTNIIPTIDDSVIQFRLDLLRLTFSIEGILERYIEQILDNKEEILVSDFRNYFEIGAEERLKAIVEENVYLKNSFVTKKKDGFEYFKISHFIRNCSFGETIKLFENISVNLITDKCPKLILNYGKRTVVSWYRNIKDIRNVLSHRTKIEVSSFFQKRSIPSKPDDKNIFIGYSDLDLKYFIVVHLLQNELSKQIILDILDKYGIKTPLIINETTKIL